MANIYDPDFDELRKPLQDLASLRTFNPRSAVTSYLFNDSSTPTPPPPAAPVATPPPAASGERTPVDLEAT